MSGSNDALTQMMLMQMRGQQRRPSTQARLAEQMMAGLNNPAPHFGAGAAMTRVGSGVLAGLMSSMAERSDQAREDQQMRQMQDRTDKRRHLDGQELAAFMGGAPAMPPQAPQVAEQPGMSPPVPSSDGVGVAASTVRYDAMPGRPPVGAAFSRPELGPERNPDGSPNLWREVDRMGPPLAPPNGRINPLPLEGAPAPGAAPQGQPDAMTMYQRAVSSNNPQIRAMAPGFLAQANRDDARANRAPTIVSPGSTVLGADNRPVFTAPRAPEAPETFGGAPQTVMQNGQPILVQIGSRGTVRPMQGYQPRNEGQFGGTGMDQQAYNTLLSLGPRVAAGTASPQEASAYALAFGHVERGNVQQIPDPTDPTGQRMVLARIPGSVPEQFPRPGAPSASGPPASPAPQATAPNATAPAAATPDAAAQSQPPGSPQIIPGTSRPGQPPTEDERRNSGFASRMIEAETLMDRQIGTGYTPGNIRDSIAGRVPVAGNFMISGQGQQFQNAAEAWVRAKLRRESGAVIGEEEMAREIRTYFPVPGDSPDTIAQKRGLRLVAVEELRTGAGRAAPPLAQPGAAAAPTRTITYDAQGRRVQQ